MTYEQVVMNWQKKNINNVSELDLALDSFKINFAYNSGKIENQSITYHDTREIFDNGGVKGYTGDLRALFEQQNQKNCYEFLLNNVMERKPVTIDFIKEVHSILTAGTFDKHRYVENGERPGEFKKHDYVIGKNEVGATPNEVESELQELVDELNGDFTQEQILTVATYFHAKFESIHPFADGNGRVGRSVMNYILMTHNFPPVIVFNDTKSDYYKALDKFDETGDIADLKQYLKNALTDTWKSKEERAKSNKKITDYLR